MESINNESIKIFNAFNEKYFDNKLPLPLIIFRKSNHGSVNADAVIKNGHHYSHEMSLPLDIINENIYSFAACILHNMIHEYDIIYEAKMASRKNYYHNKRFKCLAEKCNLSCYYTSKDEEGWLTTTNDNFKKICDDLGFKKTWGSRYCVETSTNINIPSGHSYKYTCESGESVRGTKSSHILFCLTGNPELANEIEKRYNIKRMHITNLTK